MIQPEYTARLVKCYRWKNMVRITETVHHESDGTRKIIYSPCPNTCSYADGKRPKCDGRDEYGKRCSYADTQTYTK